MLTKVDKATTIAAKYLSVFRIQILIDLGFFADPDPGFKSLDPFINKLM